MIFDTPSENSIGSTNYFVRTNIDIIDAQHQKIADLFQNLLELKIAKVDFEVVLIILDEFAEYMNVHFDTEENLMRSAGVNDVDMHIQQHDFFKNKMNEFRTSHRTRSHFLNNLNYELVLTFLRNWFAVHSHKFDLLYVVPVQRYLADSEYQPM